MKLTEERLKIHLPQDYKDFMKIANGFHAFSNVEPTFHPLDRIDYLIKIDPELISIWKDHGNRDVGEVLENSIIIAGISEEQYFLIIPPDSNNKTWRYWKFASWIPGQEPYKDMIEYFNAVLNFMKNTNY